IEEERIHPTRHEFHLRHTHHASFYVQFKGRGILASRPGGEAASGGAPTPPARPHPPQDSRHHSPPFQAERSTRRARRKTWAPGARDQAPPCGPPLHSHHERPFPTALYPQ